MRVYIDTEFTDFAGPATDLISLALVAEDGREFYAERNDFARALCSPFTRTAVLPLLGQPGAKQYTRTRLAKAVRAWLRTIPELEIVVDYDGDWDLLRELLDRELLDNLIVSNIYAELDEQAIESYYSQNGVPRHHALHDARATRWAANLVSRRNSKSSLATGNHQPERLLLVPHLVRVKEEAVTTAAPQTWPILVADSAPSARQFSPTPGHTVCSASCAWSER